MPLSAIESAILLEGKAHFVTSFELIDGQVTVSFKPIEMADTVVTTAKFPEAVVTSEWHDTEEETEWPLDVIGFDSYDAGNCRWRFVLNCATVEWCWESLWPEITNEK